VINWFDNYSLHQSTLFYRLVMLIGLMLVLGLVMVLSASNVVSIKATGDAFAEFRSQLLYAFLGFLAMIFISKRSVEALRQFSMFFFAATVILQLLVLVPGIGVTRGGNRNWLAIGGFTLQPSELLKLGMILAIATWISPHLDSLWDWRRSVVPFVGFGFMPALLVLALSNDLGTAAVMIVFVLLLAVLVGLPWKYIGIFVGTGAFVFLVAAISSPNRVRRLLSAFGLGGEGDDSNWQVKHGEWALASGGLFGTGLGDSKMKWGWIPEVENDFIFSVIGEEAGFVGAVVVLVLFFILARYLRKVSINSTTDFGSIAVTGIMLWITLQAFINIAVVLGLMPVIGVPLPLFSRGGSSMLAVLMALGVVLAVERDQARPKRSVRKK
jgi:cell division protein FtsW